jgi:hypothetical protein
MLFNKKGKAKANTPIISGAKICSTIHYVSLSMFISNKIILYLFFFFELTKVPKPLKITKDFHLFLVVKYFFSVFQILRLGCLKLYTKGYSQYNSILVCLEICILKKSQYLFF